MPIIEKVRMKQMLNNKSFPSSSPATLLRRKLSLESSRRLQAVRISIQTTKCSSSSKPNK